MGTVEGKVPRVGLHNVAFLMAFSWLSLPIWNNARQAAYIRGRSANPQHLATVLLQNDVWIIIKRCIGLIRQPHYAPFIPLRANKHNEESIRQI